jgi:AcrR family transcriptional regulator
LAGLRDRKKREVRARIVATAERLFAESGIDATTMDEIAAVSDVSVATVYNYFGSKTALLLASLEDDTEAMLAAGAPVVADPGDDPRLAAKRLVATYVRYITEWDRDLLKELMAASFRRGSDELAAEFYRMDERVLAQAVEMLQGFKDRDLLNRDVAPAEAAYLVYSVMMTTLMIYISVDWFTPEELTAQMGRQLDIAFEGLAAGN